MSTPFFDGPDYFRSRRTWGALLRRDIDCAVSLHAAALGRDRRRAFAHAGHDALVADGGNGFVLTRPRDSLIAAGRIDRRTERHLIADLGRKLRALAAEERDGDARDRRSRRRSRGRLRCGCRRGDRRGTGNRRRRGRLGSARGILTGVQAHGDEHDDGSHDREEQNAAEQHLPLRIDRSVLRRRRARIFTGRAQRYALCGFAASRTAIWTAAAQAGILAPAAPAGDLGNDAHEKPPICKDLIRICFPYHTLFGFFRQDNPANSVWFWGAGTRPMLTSFEEKYHKKGAMISAVDLLKGIAVGAGLDNIIVEGANGGLHTNYTGKAEAAVDALAAQDYDFVYVHIEAPDEMGHQGSIPDKIKAIENIDQKIIGPIVGELEDLCMDFRMLVLPDHPTPICVRTHTGNPVPYLLYDSRKKAEGMPEYSERLGNKSPLFEKEGHRLLSRLFEMDNER